MTERKFLYIKQSAGGTEYTTFEQSPSDTLENHVSSLIFSNGIAQVIAHTTNDEIAAIPIGQDNLLGQDTNNRIRGFDTSDIRRASGSSQIGTLEQNAARNFEADTTDIVGLVASDSFTAGGRDGSTDPGQIVLKNLKARTTGNLRIEPASGGRYVLLDPLVVPYSFSTTNQFFITASAGATLIPLFKAKQPISLDSGNVVVSRSTDTDNPGIRFRTMQSTRVSLTAPTASTIGGTELYNSIDGVDGTGITSTLKLSAVAADREIGADQWLFLYSEGIEDTDTPANTSGFTIYNVQLSLNFSVL